MSDITYIWTQEGWLYLAVVIDLFSMKVVGWSMSSRMKAKLLCDALQMTAWQRQPQAGLTVHSDRGSQYACKQYRQLLKIHGFIGSMIVWEIIGIIQWPRASSVALRYKSPNQYETEIKKLKNVA